MQLIVDGFNLIYKFPDLEALMYISQLQAAEKGLIEKLKIYQQITNDKIRVIFDGKKNINDTTESEKSGKIIINYSHDYSADFLIKELVKQDKNPRMLTVITSDKDILFYINRFNAKHITSEDFAKKYASVIEAHERKDIPEKPEQNEAEQHFWEKIFLKKS